MVIRLLNPNDASSFQSLRLRALREAVTSFASSYEEEVNRSTDDIQNQLTPRDDRGIFGALEGERLVGVAGLGRENLRKLSHKAFLWGVYVAPDMRGSGISRMLIAEALDFGSLGFQEFGLERHSLMIGGNLYDEVHMSLRIAG